MIHEPQTSRWSARRLVRHIWTFKPALVGITLVAGFTAMAVLGPQLSSHDPLLANTAYRLRPPGFTTPDGVRFLLGSDSLGRDVLSRIMLGARISLFVGLSSAVLGAGLGVAAGLVSGALGGWVDAVIMRLADVQLAFPRILVALLLITFAGASMTNVIVAIAITSWVIYARTVRAEVLAQKQLDYSTAARALGANLPRLVVKHYLPAIVPSIIVIGSFQVAYAIIIEASLGFLGFGVPLPTPTWGNMVADARSFIYVAWWIAVFPGLALMLAVLGINLLGDWFRVVLDPFTRGSAR